MVFCIVSGLPVSIRLEAGCTHHLPLRGDERRAGEGITRGAGDEGSWTIRVEELGGYGRRSVGVVGETLAGGDEGAGVRIRSGPEGTVPAWPRIECEGEERREDLRGPERFGRIGQGEPFRARPETTA